MTMKPFRRRSAPSAPSAAAGDAASDARQQLATGQPVMTAAEAVFELHEARRRIRDLEGDLERARRDADHIAGERAGAAVEEVAERVATPLAHLATQVALLRAGGSVLSTDDLTATASRVIGALGRAGIVLDGDVGAAVGFEPDLHTPLASEIGRGARVLVRSPAVRCAGGRVVRKGTVEPAASEQP
jgi:hypothetical protein